MRNLSPLFFRGKTNFLQNISLSEELNKIMRESVSKIKKCLNVQKAFKKGRWSGQKRTDSVLKGTA